MQALGVSAAPVDVPARRVGDALRLAAVDFYHQSWRLLGLNTALSALVIGILAVAYYAPLALALLLLVGPALAALAHAGVTLAQTEELRFRDAAIGLRLHWRRGLLLWTVTLAVVGLGWFALAFYADLGGAGYALSVLVFYLLLLFGLLQLALWPLAVFERDRPLRDVVRRAALTVARRPAGYAGLALGLAVVNAIGLAAAVLPFLTLTIAYSFVAAAHFVLPSSPIREAGT